MVEGVTFHYQDEPETDVLKDISLTLKPGTVLGLLGRTGSGKSTLTRLLFRLYDPSSGVIYMGGGAAGGEPHGMFDIRQSRLGDVRRHVGLVPQEVQLFHATVRQNLTLFDDAIPDERIIQALDEIGLGDWLAQLPEGLDTHLDSGSSGLSAGEAQLVAFGRVFLVDPGLVILDEASSRLDPATERLIEIAVNRLLKDRTAIIIAHRLGTVQRADEIMILDDGAVIEYGIRTELVRDPGSVFSRLLQTGLEEAMA
jgi:ABC-type multidrug transport system fused ATPase/permease subunit